MPWYSRHSFRSCGGSRCVATPRALMTTRRVPCEPRTRAGADARGAALGAGALADLLPDARELHRACGAGGAGSEPDGQLRLDLTRSSLLRRRRCLYQRVSERSTSPLAVADADRE